MMGLVPDRSLARFRHILKYVVGRVVRLAQRYSKAYKLIWYQSFTSNQHIPHQGELLSLPGSSLNVSDATFTTMHRSNMLSM